MDVIASLSVPLAIETGEWFIVIFLLAVPAAAILFAGAGTALDDVGRTGLSMEVDAEPELSPAEEARQRQAEMRAMLEATSRARVRRGGEPIDVEAEMTRLNARPARSQRRTPRAPSPTDPALRTEMRQHVEAANARREARGDQPLDVTTEVNRRMGELGGGPGSDTRAAQRTRAGLPPMKRATWDPSDRRPRVPKDTGPRSAAPTPGDPTAPRPATPVDPALREEVRQLVIASNRRRARRGEQPLDVDT
ncbi:MAG: hypothetical protein ACR2NA_11335, partial [Solirubrobacterales bacterium]